MSANVLKIPVRSLPVRSFSRTIKHSVCSSAKELTPNITYLFRFVFGLSVEPWLVVNLVGMLLIVSGLSNLTELFIVRYPTTAIAKLLIVIDGLWTNAIWGIGAIALGIFLSYWGQTRRVIFLAKPIECEDRRSPMETTLTRHRFGKDAKMVAVGGGTGLSSLLRGLKHHSNSNNLTAVVTVTDDGGSSGRLREELGVLPPGDIRNCMTALAEEESLLTQLFDYRFDAGDGLKGHSFGNLFLTAMSDVTGNLSTAIAACEEILAVKGRVLPATLDDVTLWAELDRGRIVTGESNIAATEGKINHIGCLPANPQALPEVIQAIESADCIILGPGSLYTSIIPNLLVPEIRTAIAKAQVPRIYVCNIMTQPGETDGYSVGDHLEAIDRACGQTLFDAVLVNQREPSAAAVRKYAQEGSHPVILDRERVTAMSRRVILADVLDEHPQTYNIRHHSAKLAQTIAQLDDGDIGNYLRAKPITDTISK